MPNPTKVLIVDDSPVVRMTVSELLASDPEIEVLGAAADPYEAVALMRRRAPDVLLLDLEMPRMDGLTFLQKIMAQHPLPVVVCSSHTTEGSRMTLKALEYGAVDVITKPRLGSKQALEESLVQLIDALKAAAGVPKNRLGPRQKQAQAPLPVSAQAPRSALLSEDTPLICIGASTGGIEAVSVVLEGLPSESPGIVLVQHMPEGFTRSFAANLDLACRIQVKEAAEGDVVRPGLVLVAPGGRHTLVKKVGSRFVIESCDGPLVSRHRPSVDVLFGSVARQAGTRAVGILLTGMGDDGAKGLLEMRKAGAHTIAQDEATSVVYGMPKEAVKMGAVGEVLPLEQIGGAALLACHAIMRKGNGAQ